MKVYDHKLKEHQALKIVKRAPELIKQTFVEIAILTKIKEKDPEDFSGIVRIKDFTLFRDHIVTISIIYAVHCFLTFRFQPLRTDACE